VTESGIEESIGLRYEPTHLHSLARHGRRVARRVTRVAYRGRMDQTAIAPGHVAVITGGASGIGRAMARAFAARGMHVVLADLDDVKMRSVEAEITEAGVDVLPVVCDTSNEAAVQALAQATLDRFGGAHVLCNNAGVVGKADAWTGSLRNWEWVLGINFYGVLHGVRAFLPIMTDQGCGHIVNTASMAGLVAVPGAAPYGVSKAGVVALSEALFIELVATGSPVRVSALCPGFVKTNLMETGTTWNPAFGAEPTTNPDDPMTQLITAAFTQGVDNGIPAEEVAAQVVDAIDAQRFWILTHEDMRHLPVERMQRAEALENPA
jgi:NAD(P)-dependent dehydrogenase (short-subunit alcohol dehydrogenase family)